MTYRDKVVVITGASRGLGAGMATAMAGQGIRLGLCARSACAAPDVDSVVRAVDVADQAAVARFAREVVEQLGSIDLWINNAGVLEPIVFVHDLSSKALMDHLAINIAGVVHGSQAYARHVREVGRGVLINISSGAALKGYAGWGAYCAGKAAVDRLTECIQLEEKDHGLIAYAVAPGVVDTDMQKTIRSLTDAQFPAVEKFLQLKRDNAFNTPAYVADELLRIAFDVAAAPSQVVHRLAPQTR